MFRVTAIDAREILDSRGQPTVEATVQLATGHAGTASVPSGASTGSAEARALHDGDPRRYRGRGCRQAVASVQGPIAQGVLGTTFSSQRELDMRLIELDGTPDKARLGANAILAVSLAFARAAAAASGQPLYEYFARLVGRSCSYLPCPTINLFSGGKHAGGQVAIQDVLIVPHARTIDACLAMAYAVYQAAVQWVADRYQCRPLKADEGGLAPEFPSSRAMLHAALAAIEQAGFIAGRDVSLAVDVAATHFYRQGRYHLDGETLDAMQLIDTLDQWARQFPLVSIEDGLAEDDWPHWPVLCQRLGPKVLIIGDDLLCTQANRVNRAVAMRAANGLLLKVNQVGTLTEAAQAWQSATAAGWRVSVSARSGETEDNWLADLATAWGHYIKVGSLAQSDRLSKYNRLLAIEQQTGWPVWSNYHRA